MLRVEAGVLEREPGRGARGEKQLGLVDEGGVVDDHGERLAVVLEARHRAAVVSSGSASGRPRPSTYSCRSGSQNPTSSVGVAERAGERVAHAVGRRPLELEHELRHVRPREARPQHARDERDRERDEPDDLPPEEVRRR